MGLVVDAHSDILNDIYPRRILGETGVFCNHWLPRMRQGGIDLRVVAIYSDIQFLPELALRRGLNLIASLYEELEECPDAVLCLSYDDIIRAKSEGKIGLLLGMEGAEPLGADIQLLRIFHALGLRVLGFTHALRTYLADGSFLRPRRTGKIGGLTDIGLTFLEKAQALGMVIDVSHLNDPSFWDVIENTKAPVIASHSNCRTLCEHPRNLADEQIKALAKTDGVVGVNANRLFVEEGTLPNLLDHIEHLVRVGGIDHVGLGPDFADYVLEHQSEREKARLPLDAIKLKPVEGFEGDEDFPKIADGLLKRGYNTADIDLIMGENFRRVFQSILRR